MIEINTNPYVLTTCFVLFVFLVAGEVLKVSTVDQLKELSVESIVNLF